MAQDKALDALKRVREAQAQKNAQGYYTENQINAAKAEQIRQQKEALETVEDFNYSVPEGQKYDTAQNISRRVLGAASSAASNLIDSLTNPYTKANLSDNDVALANKYGEWKKQKEYSEADVKRVKSLYEKGEATKQDYESALARRSIVAPSLEENKYFTPEELKRLNSTFIPAKGNSASMSDRLKQGQTSLREAIEENSKYYQRTEKLVGHEESGTKDIISRKLTGSDAGFKAPINEYYFQQEVDKVKREREAKGKGTEGFLNGIATYGKAYARNPGEIAASVAESSIYALPYVGLPAIAGDYSRFKNQASLDLLHGIGNEASKSALTQAEKGRIELTAGAYLASQFVSRAALQGAALNRGVGAKLTDKIVNSSVVNKAVNKLTPSSDLAKLALKGAGRTAAGTASIATDAAFEGTQEVFQTVMEKAATGRTASSDELAQAFVGGAFGGATFSSVGKVGSLAGQGINKASELSGLDALNATDEQSVDSSHKAYNPSRVISNQRRELSKRNKKLDAARISEIEANSNDVVSAIEKELVTVQHYQKTAEVSNPDETKIKLLEELKVLDERIENTTDTSEKQSLELEANNLVMKIANTRSPQQNKELIDKLKTNLSKARGERTATYNRIAEMRALHGIEDAPAPIPINEEYNVNEGMTDDNTEMLSHTNISDTLLDATHDDYNPSSVVKEYSKLATSELTDGEQKVLLHRAKEAVDTANKAVSELNGVTDRLNDLEQKIADKKSKLEATQQDLKDAKKNKEEAATIKKLEASIKKQEANIRAFESARTKAFNKKKNLSKKDLVKEATAAKRSYNALKGKLTKINNNRNAIISKNQREIQALNNDISLIDKAPELEKQYSDESKELQDKLIQAEISHGVNSKQAIDLRNKLDTATRNLANIRSIKSKEYYEKELAKREANIKALENRTPNSTGRKRKAKEEEIKRKEKEQQAKKETKIKSILDNKKNLEKDLANEESLLANGNLTGKERSASSSRIRGLKSRIKSAEKQLDKLGYNKKEETQETTNNNKANNETPNKPLSIVNTIQKILKSNSINNVPLTESQKKELETLARAFSDAKALENSLKSINEVQSNIFTGTDGFRGLNQYRQEISIAIQNGDLKTANSLLRQLALFEASHRSKAEQVSKAFNKAQSERAEFYVFRERDNKAKEWKLFPTKEFKKQYSKKERSKYGALLIHTGSIELVSAIQKEADFITQEYNNLTNLVNVLKGIKTQTVTNTSTNTNTDTKDENKKSFVNSNKDTVDSTENSELGHFLVPEEVNVHPLLDSRISYSNPNLYSKEVSPDIDKPLKNASISFTLINGTKSLKPALLAIAKKLKPASNKKYMQELNAVENAAVGANKFIGNGFHKPDNSIERRAAIAFEGRHNPYTFYDTKYTKDDVVFYHRESSTPKETKELAMVRKQELDAAIVAGATIHTIKGHARGSNKKLLEDIKYLESHGYKEGKDASGILNGVFVREDRAFNNNTIAKYNKLSFKDKAKVINTHVETTTSTSNNNNTNDPIENGKEDKQDKVILKGKSSYIKKDQEKSDKANKFIGFGGKTSSTNEYAKNWGDNANTGNYSKDDTVFVSVNGKRKDRISISSPQYQKELEAATKAGATIVADEKQHRDRDFNIGERELADYLISKGYKETKDGNGIWKPNKSSKNSPSIDDINSALSEAIEEDDVDNQNNTNENIIEETNEETNEEITNVDTRLIINSNSIITGIQGINEGVLDTTVFGVPEIPAQKDTTETKEGKINTDKNFLSESDTTLNSQIDFFNKFLATKDYDAVAKMIGVEKLTDSQKEQLNAFVRFHTLYSNKIREQLSVSAKNKESSDNPIYKYLLDENGNVPENVITASIVSLYQYIQTNGKSAYPDIDTIKAIHGFDKYANIPFSLRKILEQYGGHKGYLYQEIGSTAVNLLGLKLNDNAHIHLSEHIAASLGIALFTAVNEKTNNPLFIEARMPNDPAFGISLRKQFIDVAMNSNTQLAVSFLQSKLPKALFNKIKDSLYEANTQEELVNAINKYIPEEYLDKRSYFVRPAIANQWHKEHQKSYTILHPEIAAILMTSKKEKDSKDVIGELFGHSKQRIEPLEEKKEFTQTKVNKKKGLIPELFAKLLNKVSKTEYSIVSDRANALLKLYVDDKESLYTLMGVIPDTELEGLHPTLREMRIKDNNVKRDIIDQQIQWLSARRDIEGNYKTFYEMPDVWVNQRFGYESTLFNAQTDIFARTLTSIKSWEKEIDTSQPLFDEEGKITSHGMYLIAIAENMEGIKKFLDFTDKESNKYSKAARTVDKVAPQDYLPKLLKYIKTNKDLAEALKAVTNLNQGKKLSREELNSIKKVMNDLDMKELGFAALSELAVYTVAMRARKEDKKKFITHVGAKSDGVTNGPSITRYLMGLFNKGNNSYDNDRIAAGLIPMQMKDSMPDYLTTKKKGYKDIYEKLGDVMVTFRDLMKGADTTSLTSRVMDSLTLPGNEFGSRSWAKVLATPFNYGAGLFGLSNAVSNNVVNDMVNKFYSLYSLDSETANKELLAYKQDLKRLIDLHSEIFGYREINENNWQKELESLALLINHKEGALVIDADAIANKPEEVMNSIISWAGAYLTKKGKEDSKFFTYKTAGEKLNYISQHMFFRKREQNKARKNYKDFALEDDLPQAFQDMLYELAQVTFGTVSEISIRERDSDYMRVRDITTELATQAFNREKIVEKLVMKKLGYSYSTLTVKQQKDVDEIMYNYRAAVSSGISNLDEKGKIKAGLNLYKKGKATSDGHSITMNIFDRQINENKTKKYSYSISYSTEENPGVSGNALIVQSIDAAISAQVLAEIEGINYHDALGMSLDNFAEGTRLQNKYFFETAVRYNLGYEYVKAVMRPMYLLKEMYHDPSTSAEMKEDIRAMMSSYEYGQEALDIQLAKFEEMFDLDIRKLETALEDGVIHQYTGYDGQYYITAEDRKTINKALKSAKVRKEKELEKIIDFYASFLEDNTSSEYSKNTAQEIFDIEFKEFQEAINEDSESFMNTVFSILDKNPLTLSKLSSLLIKDESFLEGETSELINTYTDIIKELDDPYLNNIKVTYSNKITSNVAYSKFNNTIYIKKPNDLNSNNAVDYRKDLVKAMLEATLVNQLRSVRKGGNKKLKPYMDALNLLNINFKKIIDKAEKDGHLSSEEVNTLTSKLFDEASRPVSTEKMIMMVYANEDNINQLLSKIPDYGDLYNKATSQGIGSLLKHIMNLIYSLITGKDITKGNKNIYNVMDVLTQRLVDTKQEGSISSRLDRMYINKEDSSFGLNTRFPSLNINNDRLSKELGILKAKSRNKNKSIPALKVLNLLSQVEKELDKGNRNKEVYESSLTPIIDILKRKVRPTTKVVIVEDISDLTNNGVKGETLDRVETILLGASSFYINELDTVFITTDSIANVNSNNSRTIIHELLHSVTSDYLNNKDNSVTRAIETVLDKLNKILENDTSLNDVQRSEIAYALSSSDEFISQLLTTDYVKEWVSNTVVHKELPELLANLFTSSDATLKAENALDYFTNIINNQLFDSIKDNPDEVIEDKKYKVSINLETATSYKSVLGNINDGKDTLDVARDIAEFKLKVVPDSVDNKFFNVENLEQLNNSIISAVKPEAKVKTEKVLKSNELYQKLENEVYMSKGHLTLKEAIHKEINGLTDEQANVIADVAEANKISRDTKILNSNSIHIPQNKELFTPTEIFDNLGKPNEVTNTNLRNIIDSMVTPVMDKLSDDLIMGYSYEKVWFDAIAHNKAVYSSKAHTAGFRLTNQESYALETLEVVMAESLKDKSNTSLYSKLERAYKDAKDFLEVSDFHAGDWDDANQQEKDLAKSKFDYIFANRDKNQEGTDNYLANFAAMSLVSPELRQVLSTTIDKVAVDRTLSDIIFDAYTDSVEFITNVLSRVSNRPKTLTGKVDELSQRLMTIYAKNHDIALDNKNTWSDKLGNFIDNYGIDMSGKLKESIINAIENSPFRNTQVGQIATKLNGQIEYLDKTVNMMFDAVRPNKPLNEAGHLFNELVGTVDNPEHQTIKDAFYASKFIEQERAAIIEANIKSIQNSYAKQNRVLTVEQEKGVTNTLLRTDLQSLLNIMDFKDIMELVRNPEALNAKIKAIEGDLHQVANGYEYALRARDLGTYMAQRIAITDLLAPNALAIADRVGITGIDRNKDAKYSDLTLRKIDNLATLIALQKTSKVDKDNFVKLLDSEMTHNKNKVNGIEYTLRSHRAAVADSNSLFTDNVYSQHKGYLPNITNAVKGFKVVDDTLVEEYESRGYVKVSKLNKSKLDSNEKDFYIMTVSNTGMERYVTGALSIEETVKSGTKIPVNSLYSTNPSNYGAVHKANDALNNMLNNGVKYESNVTHLIPSYDKKGDVISYSYQMTSVGLDSFLERDNTSSTLIGQLKGANLNKAVYPNHNKKILDIIISEFDNSSERDKKKYVEVGPEASTARGRELWKLLPKESRMYAKELNGDNFLYIRNDQINLVYGFKKISLSDIFDKQVDERNFVESIYAAIFEAMFGRKAQYKSNQITAIWRDLIKDLGNFIVVRGVQVLKENIKANLAIALINHPNPIQLFKDIKDAIVYSMRYQKDKQDLIIIQDKINMGIATDKDISSRDELINAIKVNPLKEFIESGMMPSIVNDVSLKRDEVDFATSAYTALKKRFDDKAPSSMKKVVNNLLVSQDTALYRFLANATQQSDFVFKYAVYKQEQRAGKSKQDSMNKARQYFIEYDVPSSRGMQFANDMGLWMFTKFAFRFTRVLGGLIKSKPNRLLAEYIISSNLLNNQSVLGMSVFSRFTSGNIPIGFPIKDVLTMYDEAFPIQLIKQVF